MAMLDGNSHQCIVHEYLYIHGKLNAIKSSLNVTKMDCYTQGIIQERETLLLEYDFKKNNN